MHLEILIFQDAFLFLIFAILNFAECVKKAIPDPLFDAFCKINESYFILFRHLILLNKSEWFILRQKWSK
jgi:hypothetical protein